MTAYKSEYIISDSVYHYCTMCFYEDLRALITLTIKQKLFVCNRSTYHKQML